MERTRFLSLAGRTAAAAAGAGLALGCAAAMVAGGWSRSGVTADGNSDEWAGRSAATFSRAGLQLNVSSDSQRLYVLAKFRENDDAWARSAALGGLTLKVTSPGRKTVTYRLPDGPVPSFRPGAPGGDSEPGAGGFSGRFEQRRAELAGLLLVNDARGQEFRVPADGTNGPAAGFAGAFGLCTYEFSVPLADPTGAGYGVSARPGEGVALAVTAGLSPEERAARRERMAGMRGPGGEGMPERGPGGGPGTGGWHGGGLGPGGGGEERENPSVSVSVRLAASGK